MQKNFHAAISTGRGRIVFFLLATHNSTFASHCTIEILPASRSPPVHKPYRDDGLTNPFENCMALCHQYTRRAAKFSCRYLYWARQGDHFTRPARNTDFTDSTESKIFAALKVASRTRAISRRRFDQSIRKFNDTRPPVHPACRKKFTPLSQLAEAG